MEPHGLQGVLVHPKIYRDLVFVLIVTATVSLSIHVAFAALNIFLVGRRTLVERRTSSL